MISQETLRQLEFDKVLGFITGYAHSDVTLSAIRGIRPFADVREIERNSGIVAEIRGLLSLGIFLRLSSFEEITPLLERLRPSGSMLEPLELRLFIPILGICREISKQITPRCDIPLIKSSCSVVRPFPDIEEPLSASIDSDGSILDSASPLLKEIRRAKRALTARIRKKIEEIVQQNKIEIFLQDDFITQRNGRWVIPVRMDSKGMVKGVVHDVSSSGETAFMEPLEIIPFVNELENLAAEEKGEEIRIVRQLSAWIREDADEIASAFMGVVELDLRNSIASFAETYLFEKATIAENSSKLVISDGKHPLLLIRSNNDKGVEPLNMEIGGDKLVMVITGPNAGGKTIALKSAGLLSLMALSALPVPVDSAKSTFPLFSDILVNIGDEQSIEQSLSTFSANVSRLSSILKGSGSRSLVLLDELGAGTEPQQGGAIACSILHHLSLKGAVVVATTHLSEIIGFVHRSEKMLNAGMEYDPVNYAPLYRLTIGEPGESHALDIARKFGLPDSVIEYSRELLGRSGEEFSALLTDMHRTRRELEAMKIELLQEKTCLEARKNDLINREKQLDVARREAREKGWSEGKELIASSRRQIAALIDEYRKSNRKELLDDIRKIENKIETELKPAEKELKEIAADEVKVGGCFYVRSLGANAVVVSLLKNGKARMRCGSMELDIRFSELFQAEGKKEQKKDVGRVSLKVTATENADLTELNIIGRNIDEATELLEQFIGSSSLAGMREVRIIHGIGSGRLREGMRDILSKHPLVAEWRQADSFQGGGGATVVILSR